jgi:hypothetical protein
MIYKIVISILLCTFYPSFTQFTTMSSSSNLQSTSADSPVRRSPRTSQKADHSSSTSLMTPLLSRTLDLEEDEEVSLLMEELGGSGSAPAQGSEEAGTSLSPYSPACIISAEGGQIATHATIIAKNSCYKLQHAGD